MHGQGYDGIPAENSKPEIDLGHISYLLQELDKWAEQGILAADSYRVLREEYTEKQERASRAGQVQALLSDAKLARSNGLVDTARKKAMDALSISPESIPAMSLYAEICESLGQWEDAKRMFESIRALSPEEPAASEGIARVQSALDEKRHANEVAAALSRISDIANTRGVSDAVAECESFIKNNPSNAIARAMLASFYGSEGRIAEAIASINVALTLSASETQFRMQLAELQSIQSREEAERREEAQRTELEEKKRLSQARARDLLREATELLQSGRLEDALLRCKAATQLDPKNAAAHAMAGKIYQEQSRWKESEAEWSAAVHLDADNAEYAAALRNATSTREYLERPLLSRLWDKGAAALESFMEERNIQWMHMLGAAILIAGIIGVGAWVVTIQKLWGTVGRMMVVTIPLVLCASFYYGGYRLRSRLQTTATSFHGIASVLLPIDLIVAKLLFPEHLALDWNHYGLIISLISTLAYVSIAKMVRSRVLVTFAAIGFLATAFFSLSSFTHLSPAGYGTCFAIIGFGYMMLAHVIRQRGLAPFDMPFDVLAHVVTAGALSSTMIGRMLHQQSTGTPALTMLAVSLVYILAAYVIDQSRYIPIFAVVFFGFIVFDLKSMGFGIEHWYHYALGLGVMGCIFLGLVPISRRQDKERFADYYQWFGLAITAAVVMVAFGRGLFELTLSSVPSGVEVQSSLITCLLIGTFYGLGSFWLSRPKMIYGSAAVFTYSSILVARLITRPAHEYSVWMLIPTLVMLASGWLLKRRSEEHATVAFRSGNVLAVFCGALAVILWAYNGVTSAIQGVTVPRGYGNAAWIVTLFSAVYYAFIARSSGKPAGVYASVASTFVWWTLSFNWLEHHVFSAMLRSESNYGLYYLPLVMLLMMVSRRLHRAEKTEMARPCDVSGTIIALGALLLEGYYIGVANGMRHSIWISLVAYSGLFAWQSYAKREEGIFGLKSSAAAVYTYLSAAALWTGVFYALNAVGIEQPLTAIAAILLGSVGVAFGAGILERSGKPYWTRALLVSAGGVFAFSCYYGFFWGSASALLGAVAVLAVYAAWVYSNENAIALRRTVPVVGVGYLFVSVIAYTILRMQPQINTGLIIAGLALSGVAYCWSAARFRNRITAYVATLSLTEAAAILIFHLMQGSTTPGLHRLGMVGLSAVILLAGLVLARRRVSDLAEAPYVVGYVLLASDIIFTVATWADTMAAGDRLIMFAVAAASAAIWGLSAIGFRTRWFLIPFNSMLSLAYATAGAQWVMPLTSSEHANYGLWLFPLVTTMAIAGHVLHRRQLSQFGTIFHYGASALLATALSVQPMYSSLTIFVSLFAYSALMAWVSIAGRSWEMGVDTDKISEWSTYAASGLFAIGWLAMFDWLGAGASRPGLYNSIAALTGVGLCLATVGVSKLLSNRDLEWWARPLFWSSSVGASVFVIWSLLSHESMPVLTLATISLSMLLYTVVARLRRGLEFGYWGIAVFTIGYLTVFHNMMDFIAYSTPIRLLLLGLAAGIAAVCSGYTCLMVRSVPFSYITTITSATSYLLLLAALTEAAGPILDGWYSLGVAVLGLALFGASERLRRRGFPELSTAPSHAADLFAGLAAIPVLVFWLVEHEGYITAATLAVCASIFALKAAFRATPRYLYPAAVAAVVGWGVLPWQEFTHIEANTGFFYIPLVIVLGALSYVLRSRNQDSFARPLWQSALVISIGSIVSQFSWSGQWPTVPIALFTYSALYAVASYLDRDEPVRVELMTYLSCASLLLCAVTIIPKPIPAWAVYVYKTAPIALAALGLVWAQIASRLSNQDRNVWVRPLLISAGFAEALAAISSVALLHNHNTLLSIDSIAVIAAASVVAWMALRFENRAMTHLSCALTIVGSLCLTLHPEAGLTTHHWYVLLPLLFGAVGASVMALMSNSKEYAVWSPVLLFVGFIVFAASGKVNVLSPEPVYCGLVIVAMGACAIAYDMLVRRMDLLEMELAGAVAGFIGYWYSLVLVGSIPGLHFSPIDHAAISILPFAAFLMLMCCGQRQSDQTDVTRPYGIVSVAVSIIGIVAGLAGSESPTLLAVTFLLYALSYGAAAIRFRSSEFAYMSNGIMLLAWHSLYTAMGSPAPKTALPLYGAWFALLGLLEVCGGLFLHHQEHLRKYAKPFFVIGAAIASVSALMALGSVPSNRELGVWTVAALILHSIVYAAIAVVYRRIRFVHIGFASIVICLYMVFYDKPNLYLDIYALPIGLYLLTLPSISKRIGGKVNANPLYSAGLTIMLGSGLLTIMRTGLNSWNSYLMLAESVGAFLYGMSRHRKEFFFFGTGFSAIWVGVLIRNSVIKGMHGGGTLAAGVIGIIVGTSLIVFASCSEQKRAQVLASIRRAATSLRDWQ